MCLLTFCPHGKTPTREYLENGNASNPDGYGFAILAEENQKLIVFHSLSAEETTDKFFAVRENHQGPAIFHSRFGTDGDRSNSLPNCHPFGVGYSTDTVVAHNGIITQCRSTQKGDRRSDTAIWARHVLPKHHPHTEAGKHKAEKFLGQGNKAVILSTDATKYPDGYLILNEDQGSWADDGCWYSNSGYKGWRSKYGHGEPYYTTHYYNGSGWVPFARRAKESWLLEADNAGFFECWSCGKDSVHPKLGICRNYLCMTCQDCGKFATRAETKHACVCTINWSCGTEWKLPFGENPTAARYCYLCNTSGHTWVACDYQWMMDPQYREVIQEFEVKRPFELPAGPNDLSSPVSDVEDSIEQLIKDIQSEEND